MTEVAATLTNQVWSCARCLSGSGVSLCGVVAEFSELQGRCERSSHPFPPEADCAVFWGYNPVQDDRCDLTRVCNPRSMSFDSLSRAPSPNGSQLLGLGWIRNAQADPHFNLHHLN